MLEIDEKRHITRTQQGDTDAFTTLISKYHKRLHTHIRRRVKDTEIAKDLTQETWLKVLRAIHTYRGTAAFSSWLYRIAENVCIDFFRKQKAADTIDPLETVDEQRITRASPDPYQHIERAELREMLRQAVSLLPPTRKRVFLLYYVQELPIKVIATRINRSEGTIKTHLRNARLQLCECLTPYIENQNILWLA